MHPLSLPIYMPTSMAELDLYPMIYATSLPSFHIPIQLLRYFIMSSRRFSLLRTSTSRVASLALIALLQISTSYIMLHQTADINTHIIVIRYANTPLISFHVFDDK